VIYFKTVDMDIPKIWIQESSEHPDEVACLLSFVPTFTTSLKIREPQEPVYEENEKPEEDDMPELVEKNCYIFIVDRSGSM
jgi:hypothetical protein